MRTTSADQAGAGFAGTTLARNELIMGDAASGLRGVFNSALASVLAATGLSACSGETAVAPGIDGDPGFVPVECVGGAQRWLDGLNPALVTEYSELRLLDFSGARQVIEALGTRCAGAADAVRCEQEFSALVSSQGIKLGACGGDVPCPSVQLAATQGQTAVLLASAAELIAFLGPIDTPKEAMLVVQTAGVEVACQRGGAKPQGDGFDVQAFTYQGCDGRTRHIQHVDANGTVRSIDGVVEKKPTPNCAVGRRPCGLLPTKPRASRSALGRYWADAARLEAASIAAFRRLRRELCLHGAPRPLLDAARRAARDEVRHARMVGSLARTCGTVPDAARITPLPLRELEVVARENAAEGCVRETYGALVALWQARFAKHAAVRAAYARIAEDELRHAALAWRVAAWSEPRLTPAGRVRVRHARDEAVMELLAELRVDPERELTRGAGVPRAAPAVALAEQLRASIWNSA